eukprot:Cvel_1222.t2-p1 / transcript=Cvel_1222.t2 / gene=Cvel_1222 / organism=Chromera_velia_CCMP2878 / gene_product=Late secretory pathway protein AVL9 homolog, putative / transcript_product=Late secretory pathway protein AVL9 homolog, putative / location=Cvel_scaffold40:164143-170917(+) / protein_length=679 / sequence_SO=supercontig / SO=protein_coding / is_pseudo=false
MQGFRSRLSNLASRISGGKRSGGGGEGERGHRGGNAPSAHTVTATEPFDASSEDQGGGAAVELSAPLPPLNFKSHSPADGVFAICNSSDEEEDGTEDGDDEAVGGNIPSSSRHLSPLTCSDNRRASSPAGALTGGGVSFRLGKSDAEEEGETQTGGEPRALFQRLRSSSTSRLNLNFNSHSPSASSAAHDEKATPHAIGGAGEAGGTGRRTDFTPSAFRSDGNLPHPQQQQQQARARQQHRGVAAALSYDAKTDGPAVLCVLLVAFHHLHGPMIEYVYPPDSFRLHSSAAGGHTEGGGEGQKNDGGKGAAGGTEGKEGGADGEREGEEGVDFEEDESVHPEFVHVPLTVWRRQPRRVKGSAGWKRDLRSVRKFIAFLALPDAGHHGERDTVFFCLPAVSGRLLFGVSCFRAVAADQLMHKEKDVTRGVVQKSVCVVSQVPFFGTLLLQLDSATEAFVLQRDFRNTELLEALWRQLNARDFSRLPLLHLYDLSLTQCVVMPPSSPRTQQQGGGQTGKAQQGAVGGTEREQAESGEASVVSQGNRKERKGIMTLPDDGSTPVQAEGQTASSSSAAAAATSDPRDTSSPPVPSTTPGGSGGGGAFRLNAPPPLFDERERERESSLALILRPQKLLMLIKALLLETKIVFYSSSAVKSSSAVLSLLSFVPGQSLSSCETRKKI